MAKDPKKILTMTDRDLLLPGAVVSRLVWKSQRPFSGRHPAERGRRATRASRPVASRTLQRLACRILSSR